MDRPRNSALSRFLVSGMLVVLGACGGGADTVQNPAGPGGATATYTRSAAGDCRCPGVQAQRLGQPQSHQPLRAVSRRGWSDAAVRPAGRRQPRLRSGQHRRYASLAAGLADGPKVGGGHNCWLASNEACADILTTWISNWAGAIATAAAASCSSRRCCATRVRARASRRMRRSTRAPSIRSSSSTAQRCHSPSAATAQSPYFASEDITEAYGAAKTKINLDQPALSRLVVRLRKRVPQLLERLRGEREHHAGGDPGLRQPDAH